MIGNQKGTNEGINIDINKQFLSVYKQARTTGNLQLCGQNLDQFPMEICQFSALNFEQKWWELLPLKKIDISDNKISVIPVALANERELISIRAQNNKLSQFDSVFFSLPQLKQIDLAHNCIQALEIANQQDNQNINQSVLIDLNVSFNKLDEIPMAIQLCKNIQILNLQSNRIVKLNIMSLHKLNILNLSQNNIQHITMLSFKDLFALKELILSENQIQEVEENAFANLSNLISLDLRQNKLQRFFEIPNSQNLDSLILSYNQLQIVTNFEKAKNLTVIDIKNNKIQHLDMQVCGLAKLKTLDVSNNDLRELPNELGGIKSLVRLSVEGNPLKTIKQTVKTAGANAIKQFLLSRMQIGGGEQIQSHQHAHQSQQQCQTSDNVNWDAMIRDFQQNDELCIRNCKLQCIGEKILQTQGIKVLNLSDNQITFVPEQINQMKWLQVFVIENNLLQCLPLTFMQLEQIRTVNVRKNKFKTLFNNNEINNISNTKQPRLLNLQELILSNNFFERIPSEIFLFQSLTSLSMSYNKITNIDEIFAQNVPKLETIDFSNNQISTLPIEESFYCQNSRIANINISNNNISKIPTCLGIVFDNLKQLSIVGNPQKIVPQAILNQGNSQVIQYLKNKHPVLAQQPN